jgi:hypothetical protein
MGIRTGTDDILHISLIIRLLRKQGPPVASIILNILTLMSTTMNVSAISTGNENRSGNANAIVRMDVSVVTSDVPES